MKKLVLLCCVLFGICLGEVWSFKDQISNEVTIKLPVKRIVVMQHHSLDILTQLGAQDKIVGIEKDWEKDLGSYMKKVFPGIEMVATPGGLQEWNIEEILKLKPDVVIAAIQVNPTNIKKLEKLGIPVIVVSLRSQGTQKEAQNPRLSNADLAYTQGCEWALKTLGKLVGAQKRANEIWEFAMQSREIVEKAVGKIQDRDRVRVFVANEGGMTYGNDKYVGTQLLRAGAINVAAKEIHGYKPYTLEKLLVWNPDVIIVQDRYKRVYDEFLSDKKYASLKAIKAKNLLLAPYWTKPFGNPSTDSIALGELWLASKFYPQKISEELVKSRVRSFYQRFYGVDFDEL